VEQTQQVEANSGSVPTQWSQCEQQYQQRHGEPVLCVSRNCYGGHHLAGEGQILGQNGYEADVQECPHTPKKQAST